MTDSSSTSGRGERGAVSVEEALERLQEGNDRFARGKPIFHDDLAKMKETAAHGQSPFALVLGCMDSRVPPAVIFDQDIGDLFCLRVAGNVLNDDILGSLEFGVCLAGARLVVVLGHTDCGAVKAACDGREFGHLTAVLDRIRPAIDAVVSGGTELSSQNTDLVREVCAENARRVATQVAAQSAALRQEFDAGEAAVVPALYDLATGRVEFL